MTPSRGTSPVFPLPCLLEAACVTGDTAVYWGVRSAGRTGRKWDRAGEPSHGGADVTKSPLSGGTSRAKTAFVEGDRSQLEAVPLTAGLSQRGL